MCNYTKNEMHFSYKPNLLCKVLQLVQNLSNATFLFSIQITLGQKTNGSKYSAEKTEQ